MNPDPLIRYDFFISLMLFEGLILFGSWHCCCHTKVVFSVPCELEIYLPSTPSVTCEPSTSTMIFLSLQIGCLTQKKWGYIHQNFHVLVYVRYETESERGLSDSKVARGISLFFLQKCMIFKVGEGSLDNGLF
jgi:hypothetical protein